MRSTIQANLVSFIVPALDTLEHTIEALSQVRRCIRRVRTEIILVDQSALLGLARTLPPEVVHVRTEGSLRLPQLLWTGILATQGDIIAWFPAAPPVGDLDVAVDCVMQQECIIIPGRPDAVARLLVEPVERIGKMSVRRRCGFRLCKNPFVVRRATALRLARHLSLWGDFTVVTAAVLAAMRLPVFVDRGLVSPEPAEKPARLPAPAVIREPPAILRQPDKPLVSVVITAHNEGAEVLRTIESVEVNTKAPIEFIVVDDGSTDGSCANLDRERLRVICRDGPVGVAHGRNTGARQAAGDVLVFLDGHQRVSPGCLEHCARVALSHGAIVYPDVRALHNRTAVAHGAFFRLRENAKVFSAAWNTRRFGREITKITSLRAPGYFVPRNLFEQLCWISQLRGWGGTEAAIAIKAFFLGIDILHVCGPVARHLFRPTFQYSVHEESVVRNHALIARVCFDDRTWFEHWLPRVFDGHLSPQTVRDLEAADVVAEHQEFMKLKRRPDREFWLGLLRRKEPENLRSPPSVFGICSAPANIES